VIAWRLRLPILPRGLELFELVETSSVKRSAGILMFRLSGRKPMVLLVHPGGPFWRNKDRSSWSIPKGEFGDDETAEAAAVREFEEETGFHPSGALLPLGEAIQAGGKRVVAFAMAGDLDATRAESVSCEVEWPPNSGRLIRVPEVDRAAWFTLEEARNKIIKAQSVFLDRLEQILSPMP
jgi:predicted NUDIX family NTP pyrophosphohydrolase